MFIVPSTCGINCSPQLQACGLFDGMVGYAARADAWARRLRRLCPPYDLRQQREHHVTDLNGQIAWVTGAGTGIGEAGALALAREGMAVVLTGRRREPLAAVAARIAADGGTATVE